MSWQTYVDDQLMATGIISNAVICGHDGNIWAQSKDFNVTVDELKSLLNKFGKTDELATSGIVIAGTKYMYLSSDERVLRAKKGTSGIHIIKTTQAYIVCRYEDPAVPEQAATVTEKLGDYLISVGY